MKDNEDYIENENFDEIKEMIQENEITMEEI